MKYGQNFERESVPGWSLHNIDYNSLKHFIKVHTTRHEAKAIAIPGQPDTHLAKVENDLYHELCIQYDRAGLFVTAKADEISRRLQHLSDDIHRFLLRCADSEPDSIPRKRQLKYMKLEREVVRCGNDIQDLRRFVGAQAIAFRKLLKKYKKWTGSAALGARFRENILNQPASFTKKDFESLQETYESILSTMHNSTPARSIPSSPAPEHAHLVNSATTSPRQSLRRVTIQTSTAQTYSYPHAGDQPMNYWNEYDNGSENGDVDDAYAIYVDPDEPGSPDFRAILHAFTRPFSRARSWVKSQRPEDQPLLVGQGRPDSTYGSIDSLPSATDSSYFTHPPGRPPPSRGNDSSTAVETDANEDMDIEAEYSSSEGFPAGYETHYASLPSIQDQRMHAYKDRVLFLATSGLFSMAFLLLGISTVLIFTGRHKLRVEVDAGATLGSVISIGCGCTALALTLTRWDNLSIANRAVVMVTFITVFVLNGMLLVLVLGNTAL